MGWSQGLARKLARPARGGPSTEWSQDVVRELTYLTDERWSRMTDNTLHLPPMSLHFLSMASCEAFSLSSEDSKLACPADRGPSMEWSQGVARELTYLADERWSKMTDNSLHLSPMRVGLFMVRVSIYYPKCSVYLFY